MGPSAAGAETGEDVTVIVPVLNESESVGELAAEIDHAFAAHPELRYSVLFVDDGSTDGTWDEIVKVADTRETVGGARLRRNFGKAAALAVGSDLARGEVVVTMDGDLQDDPAEIPALLERLELGADLVSGWKRRRNDPLSRRILSKVFNRVTSAVCGLRLRDYNCGYKAGRRDVYRQVPLYGELHRYVPAMAHELGYRVEEMEVHHRPRRHGRSRYGLERYGRGLLDLFTMLVITRYGRRPGHFFGGLGLLLGLVGFGVLAYLTGVWIFTDRTIGDRPLLLLGVLFEVVAVQLVSIGILSELLLHRTAPRPESGDIVVEAVGR